MACSFCGCWPPLFDPTAGARDVAKNTGEGFRRGSVNDRTQTHNPKTENWVKRDTNNGRFIDQKTNGTPFKGVAKEKDDRRK